MNLRLDLGEEQGVILVIGGEGDARGGKRQSGTDEEGSHVSVDANCQINYYNSRCNTRTHSRVPKARSEILTALIALLNHYKNRLLGFWGFGVLGFCSFLYKKI